MPLKPLSVRQRYGSTLDLFVCSREVEDGPFRHRSSRRRERVVDAHSSSSSHSIHSISYGSSDCCSASAPARQTPRPAKCPSSSQNSSRSVTSGCARETWASQASGGPPRGGEPVGDRPLAELDDLRPLAIPLGAPVLGAPVAPGREAALRRAAVILERLAAASADRARSSAPAAGRRPRSARRGPPPARSAPRRAPPPR